MIARRGFTLLEAVLAAVLAGIVLAAAMGVLGMLYRVEDTLADRHEQAAGLSTVQTVARNAFGSLRMADTASEDGTNVDGADTEPEPTNDTAPTLAPRPRFVLEPDTSPDLEYVPLREGIAPAGSVQRMEVAVYKAPAPSILGGALADWRIDDPLVESLGLSEDEAETLMGTASSDGPMRGAFELRPDGTRERVMLALGIGRPDWGVSPEPPSDAVLAGLPDGTEDDEIGWTLWWRPMESTEVDLRRLGTPIAVDTAPSELALTRLSRAVRLATGIRAARWQVYSDRQRLDAFGALSWRDLPAYIEFECQTLAGHYANWMFEVSWDTGTDPVVVVQSVGLDAEDSGQGGETAVSEEALEQAEEVVP